MLRFNPLVAGLGMALLASACTTTYMDNAAGLTMAQPGILVHKDPLRSGVLIDQVDGHRDGVRPATTYRFAPGEHSLRTRANVAFMSSEPQMIWFDVAPGGRYEMRTLVDPTHGVWGVGIFDTATGTRVDRLSPHRKDRATN